MVFEIQTSSATSWIVKKLITFQPFWMFSSFFYAHGRPECSLSSTEVGPPLKPLYHSRVCILLMALSLYACFNILKVSQTVFSNFHTNTLLMKFTQFLIAEKFAKQARWAFPLIDTA